MDLFLQAWGGLGYLLNKVFLARAETYDHEEETAWRIRAWKVYLLGLPAWIIILFDRGDYIAAGVELGGAPSMILGWVIARHGVEQIPRWAQVTGSVFLYSMLSLGFGYSWYAYGGLTAWSQALELVSMLGFLVGTYLLAYKNLNGWWWFMLMNASMCALMYARSNWILVAQHAVSFGFDVRGIRQAKRTSRAI